MKILITLALAAVVLTAAIRHLHTASINATDRRMDRDEAIDRKAHASWERVHEREVDFDDWRRLYRLDQLPK